MKNTWVLAAAACCALSIQSMVQAAEPTEIPSHVGRTIKSFELQDYLGAKHSLDKYRDHKVVVVAFLGTECPLARLYASRLVELSEKFAARGVMFLGIDSNRQDSLQEIAHYARTYDIDFPILKDTGNLVADQFGALRTPEIFVLDQRREVRYWGRIDDQFGVGVQRHDVGREHLAVALEELLTGTPVSTSAVEPVGCFIGRIRKKTPTGDITYSNQVSRILQQRCVQCHREGEIAPFTLTSYEDVSGWADTIREVIDNGRMPPWHASSKYGTFANDARMPDDEKHLVREWIANGLPEGDSEDLPPARKFPDGWSIPEPDVVFTMPKAYTVPERGVVEYQYFTLDPGFTEDRWVRASEIRPGNRAVVHHVIMYVQPPGSEPVRRSGGLGYDFLAVFAPGTPPMKLQPGQAKMIPAGSKLVFQVHYTPNGTEQTDQSQVGLVFADPSDVRKLVKPAFVLNHRFEIPAGAKNHRVVAQHRFDNDSLLISLMPHMHLRGKSFQFVAVDTDGQHEILLDVPHYDFNWQNVYELAEPRIMPEGSQLICVGHFDNSAENLVNPDPTIPVRFGEQTWEEMLVGYFEYALVDQDLSQPSPSVEKQDDGQFQVTFSIRAPRSAKAVYLAGTFNEWKPTGHPMQGPDKDGRWQTTLTLPTGIHEYKFVIDGKIWRADPGNPLRMGFYQNSALRLRK